MTVASQPSPGNSRADKRFNFAACVIDAVGWPLGMAFFSVTTLLPVLLRHLGAGNVTVGALPALFNGLMFAPGFLLVGRLRRLQRARPLLMGVAATERLALLPLVLLVPRWGVSHPQWLVWALFACMGTSALALGLNQPVYYVVVGKTIPAHWRGRLYGYAGGLAGILGIGVDGILRHLLSGPNGGFPQGFADCFAIGFATLAVSVVPLGLIREPPGHKGSAADPHSGHYGQDSRAVWKSNAPFRRFLQGQICFQLGALATPFYVLDAVHRVHAGPDAVAGYTATLVLSAAFGSLFWGHWADRRGNKNVLLASGLCAAAGALLALLAPSAGVFYGVFALSALASAGVGIMGTNMVMEYAKTSRDIPLYTAVYNMVTAGPRALAPLLGGFVADMAHSYRPAFVLSAVFALASFVLMLRAAEPRGKAQAALTRD